MAALQWTSASWLWLRVLNFEVDCGLQIHVFIPLLDIIRY